MSSVFKKYGAVKITVGALGLGFTGAAGAIGVQLANHPVAPRQCDVDVPADEGSAAKMDVSANKFECK